MEPTFNMTTIVGNSGLIEPFTTKTFELTAGYAGAFSPRLVKIKVLDDNNNEVNCDIIEITVEDRSCFDNYAALELKKNRTNSIFFKEFLPVNWRTFGACEGQGIKFTVRNTKDCDCIFYVMIYGYHDTIDNIGSHSVV